MPVNGAGIWELPREMSSPISPEDVLRKRHALREELLVQPHLLPLRIAILGGSTTAEIRSILELFLLAAGIQPEFYESGYNSYYEEVLFEKPELRSFQPDVVFVHTTWHNIAQFPQLLQADDDVEELVRREMDKFERLWEKIHTQFGSLIIQNNFDLPSLRPLGNLEASEPSGRLHFLLRLNSEFARYAHVHSKFLINDIHYLSARVGLAQWHEDSYWYCYRMAVGPFGAFAIAQNVAVMIKSALGKSRKCLVLDLDNTLWGGLIGDDGLQNLVLGRDHPVGEAFLNFQHYVKGLRQRGILLAACSKNDCETAKEGFRHPDSVLAVHDFSAFKANWNPKPDNIREIASELNIGLNSLVFVDDNPAERALVAAQLPEVAVPNVGSDVSSFAGILECAGYFEPVKILQDDLARADYYRGNEQRAASQGRFQSYDEFLASLEMTAEIDAFRPVYLDRITQLINKSNQFNLTSRRYTRAEVEVISRASKYITLYGRLSDTFGDNGLVSVLIGSIHDQTLEIDLWAMSCRVLKREMEYAVFDTLVEKCIARGIHKIAGVYIPSKKNAIVSDHYSKLGFSRVPDSPAERVLWHFSTPGTYVPMTKHIRRSTEMLLEAG